MRKIPTIGERMRERGAEFFTGRDEQIQALNLALDAVEHNFEPPYRAAKTFIAISGEGGMGKTTLLWEFERVCRGRGVRSIYVELRRKEEPHGIIDFIRAVRPWFPPTGGRRLVGQAPFEEFDRAYRRYLGLEKKLRAIESRRTNPSEMLAEMGSRVAVGLGKELPFGQTATALISEERLREGIESVLTVSGKLGRNILMKVFEQAEDVDFYYDHEEILTRKFVRGVGSYVKDEPLVLLIDSYEEAILSG